MIEGFAAQLAISHITTKDLSQLESIVDSMEKSMKKNNFKEVIKYNISFHRKMIHLSKNTNLAKVYESILLPVRRYQKMGLSLQSSWDVSLEEHKKILEALSARDTARAEEMCRNHVLKAKKRLTDCLLASRKGDDKNEYEVYGDVKGR
jgi:DNA-binding GntR family transcriptional regulator